MDISQEDLSRILLSFYKLTRDIQSNSYDRDHRKYQLRDKNLAVLRTFFSTVEVCFENSEQRKYFNSVVETYLSKLMEVPVNETEALTLIKKIETLLKEHENKVIYNRFLSVLLEYKFQEDKFKE